MFRILIAGSRSFTDYVILRRHVLPIVSSHLPDVSVISGKAAGADTLGEQFAAEFSLPVLSFPADWSNISTPGAVVRYHGDGRPFNARAGPDRNQRMLDDGKPDH